MTSFFVAVYFVLLNSGPTMLMQPDHYKTMEECAAAVQTNEERLEAAKNVEGYLAKCFRINLDL